MVGEFGVKELVLNIFFLSSTCRLILVEINKSSSVVDGVINNKL